MGAAVGNRAFALKSDAHRREHQHIDQAHVWREFIRPLRVEKFDHTKLW